MNYSKLKQINAILLCLIAVFAILYVGADFLVAFTFAIFITMLMIPVADKLEEWGIGRTLASLISTFIVFAVVSGLSYLMFFQLRNLADDLPDIRNESEQLLSRLQGFVSSITGISRQEQVQFLQQRSDDLLGALETEVTQFLGNFLETFLKFLLVLIYMFLLLLYRDRFADVVLMYTSGEKEEKAKSVLSKTSHVAHQYLWGRIKVMALLAIMYIIAFIAFDIRYPVLLTAFGALVTIIPYIGPLVSGILPVFVAILYIEDPTVLLLFALTVLVIQLIESYVFEPVIIGSEVQLNPLTVIIAIIIGNMVWGLPGMILFVPIFAIFKILSDRVNSLRPVGYLIGTSKSGSGIGLIDRAKDFFKNIVKSK
ncbi:AI-2E family transporter [Pontibacter diazotrophicus]|uniref:AI-2E family transporter n=1 Tax=Pontibacter diazotrophicus TaxID=1400979 RepID=A0A3D8LFW1_9BACT|nr:AI-2E family transporter [Pontibacter diazotrophicus]RDV16268.1 AI-2E family transporter [Pontibacter diazotrophicus]